MGQIAITSAPSGHLIRLIRVPDSPLSLSPCDVRQSVVWTGGQGGLFETRTDTGATRRILSNVSQPQPLAVASGAFFTGRQNRLVRVAPVDGSTHGIAGSGNDWPYYCLAVDASGKTLASGQYTVSLFDVRTGKVRRQLKGAGDGSWVECVALSESKVACGRSNGYVDVWRKSAGSRL